MIDMKSVNARGTNLLWLNTLQEELQPPSSTPVVEQFDWEQAVHDMLADIRDAYSSIQIEMTTPEAFSPECEPEGPYLLLSREFVEGMAASGEGLQDGYALLDELIGKLRQLAERLLQETGMKASLGASVSGRGEVSLLQTKESATALGIRSVKSYQDKKNGRVFEIQTEKGTIRFSIKKRRRYSAGSDLSRLAKAITSKDVKKVLSGLYSQMGQLSTNTDGDAKENSQMKLQMQQVIRHARAKIKKLEEEARDEKRAQRAIRENRPRQAKRRLEQLEKKRRERKQEEYGRIRAGYVKDAQNSIRRAQAQRLDNQLEALGEIQEMQRMSTVYEVERRMTERLGMDGMQDTSVTAPESAGMGGVDISV